MAYLQYSDITDEMLKAFDQSDVEAYFTEIDDEIKDLAEQLGVNSAEIDDDYKDTGRIHYKIRRYGLAYLGYRFFFDKAGVNLTEFSPDQEKYYIKAGEYKKMYGQYRGEINAQMFVDNVITSSDRAAYSSIIVRQ